MDALPDDNLCEVFSYLQRSDVIAWSRVNTYWYARVARAYEKTLYRGLVITLMPDKTIRWQGQWTKGKWVSRARLEINCPGSSRLCRWPTQCDIVTCNKGHTYPYTAEFVTDAHGGIRQPDDFKLPYGWQNLAHIICLRNRHLIMDEIHRFLWIVRFWENNHPLLSPKHVVKV